MKPTVGRIVHYTNLGDKDGKYPPEQQAAIITKAVSKGDAFPEGTIEEDGYEVSLHIFYPTGQFDMQNVRYSPEYQRGHWTWPAKT